jgi:uncharacterized alpha-E superfamily protein
MLSRVADCAYWMSRYLERAEHTARLGDVCLGLTLDRSPGTVRRLLATIGSAPTGDGVSTDGSSGDRGSEGRLDLAHRDAIVACVAAARENARQVREQISTEMWERLNRLYLDVRYGYKESVGTHGSDFYRYVKEAAHTFQGVTDSTMTHGEGWHYIQIGRLIERAATTATMLEVHFCDARADDLHGIGAYIEWVGLLRSCSAFEAYCRCYTADIRPERVAEFLLLNPDFPRSVRFAVDGVEASLTAIGRLVGRSSGGRVDRLAGRLRASLNYTQIDEIMDDSLQSYVQGIRRQCQQVHVGIYQTYIRYSLESAMAL